MSNILTLPEYQEIKAHLIKAANLFLDSSDTTLDDLPISKKQIERFNRSLKLTEIKLPDWFSKCATFDSILIPSELTSEETEWSEVDWWTAAFILLECWHERLWENDFGSINSYSLKLIDWDHRAWEFPIVNQIFIFLEAWSQKLRHGHLELNQKFRSNVTLTFDLDAINRTFLHSSKHFSFLLFNLGRSLFHRNLNDIHESIRCLVTYIKAFKNRALCNEFLDYLKESNDCSAMRINIFARLKGGSTRVNLLDPTYTLDSDFEKLLPHLISAKIEIGLHSSAMNYQNSSLIREQKFLLENKIGQTIHSNRTHWLKFSWDNSWDILDSNDFVYDETLMFNDRPGFRNSASLLWNPWSQRQAKTLNIFVKPSILMDSHLYLYRTIDEEMRKEVIRRYFQINSMYGGNASIIWHPHTLSLGYGWNSSFQEILRNLRSIN